MGDRYPFFIVDREPYRAKIGAVRIAVPQQNLFGVITRPVSRRHA